MTLGAGFAYKHVYEDESMAMLVGCSVVFLGASIGCTISMLLGRFVFRDWVTE